MEKFKRNEKMNLLKDCIGKASPKQIDYFENLITQKLPINYKKLIYQCDYGCPEKSLIIFFDRLIEDLDKDCIGKFLSFSSYNIESDNMFGVIKNPPEFFPKNIVAFANDPGGNYFCFDYRTDPKTDNPPIVFWNHEGAGTEKSISFLAKDFEAFMRMLKSEEEAEEEYQRLMKNT